MSKALQFIQAVARKLISMRGEGIASIGNKMQAEAKAGEIAAMFQESGLPLSRLDQFIRSEKDVIKYLNIIEESKKTKVKQSIQPESLMKSSKSGDVIDFPPERITDWTKARPQPPEIEMIDGVQTTRGMGDLFEKQMKNIGKKDPALYEDRGENIIPTQFSEAPAFPSYTAKETDAQILARLKKQNKDAAERLRNKKNKDPEDPQKFYQGGQAQIEPDLSGIGHGSDALMARNMLIAPGSQATTSTGLNYLLGEDNDTTRVPYNEGLKVEGPDPRILELMLNEKMSYEDALKEFENRMKQQPYIDERYNMGPGPILEAAEGGRIGYKNAGPVVLPKPKPKPNADPLIELQRIYDLYQESMPGVSQETQKYLQQDFIQKLNDAGISQEQFMTNQMQNNFAEGGPARQNFKMGKRAFLKLIGGVGAGIAGIKTGLFGLGKKTVAKSVIAPAAQAANEAGIPPYFFKLVNKIKLLGDDVTETSALTERQTVKRYKDFELTEDVSTGRIEIQRYKVLDDGQGQADYYGQPLTEETYMSYTPGETIIGKGNKPIKTQPDYQEGTAYLRNDREYAGEVVDEMSGVSDDIFKEVGEEIPEIIRKTKADGGRIGYKLGKKVVQKGIPSLIKKVNKLFGKEVVTTADKLPIPKKTLDRDMFNAANKRLNKKRQLTDTEIQDYEMELGDSETWMSEGTLGEAENALKNYKAYQDDMFRDYKAGKLDPVAGDKSPARKRFLEQKLEDMEMSGDKRLMTRDEIEELSTFDLGTQMDQMKEVEINKIKKGLSKKDKLKKELSDIEDKIEDMIESGVDEMDPRLDKLNTRQNELGIQLDFENKFDTQVFKDTEGGIKGITMGGDNEFKKAMSEAIQEGMRESENMKRLGLNPSKQSDFFKYEKMKELGQLEKNVTGLSDMSETDTLMQKYPGMDRPLADQIASSSPAMKADMIAMVEQTFKMSEKGMSGDDIIQTFKNTPRTKQATGGLASILGE
jgi:hypothetical protein